MFELTHAKTPLASRKENEISDNCNFSFRNLQSAKQTKFSHRALVFNLIIYSISIFNFVHLLKINTDNCSRLMRRTLREKKKREMNKQIYGRRRSEKLQRCNYSEIRIFVLLPWRYICLYSLFASVQNELLTYFDDEAKEYFHYHPLRENFRLSSQLN